MIYLEVEITELRRGLNKFSIVELYLGMMKQDGDNYDDLDDVKKFAGGIGLTGEGARELQAAVDRGWKRYRGLIQPASHRAPAYQEEYIAAGVEEYIGDRTDAEDPPGSLNFAELEFPDFEPPEFPEDKPDFFNANTWGGSWTWLLWLIPVLLANVRLSPVSEDGHRQSPYSFTRRQLFRRTALGGAAFVLGRFASPQKAEGYATFKEGVGEVLFKTIDFVPFNQMRWDRNQIAGQVVEILSDFFTQYTTLIQPFGKTFGLPDRQRFEGLKYRGYNEIVNDPSTGLRTIPRPGILFRFLRLVGPELEDLFRKANGTDFSTDPEIWWNQVIYDALPRYFAARGILFFLKHIEFDDLQTPQAISRIDAFGLS